MKQKSVRSRAPSASSEAVRRIMKANYGGNLRPERLLRAVLRQEGFRFGYHSRPLRTLRCTADLVFRRKRVCVFVDGCFWHGCPQHFKPPKTNTRWWSEKMVETKQRDARQRRQLRAAGWRVVRVWEHDLDRDPAGIANRIMHLLSRKQA